MLHIDTALYILIRNRIREKCLSSNRVETIVPIWIIILTQEKLIIYCSWSKLIIFRFKRFVRKVHEVIQEITEMGSKKLF